MILYIHNKLKIAATIDEIRTDHQTQFVPYSKYFTPIQAIGIAIKITLKSVRKRKGVGLSIPCIALHVIIPIATNGYVKAHILKYLIASSIVFGSLVKPCII